MLNYFLTFWDLVVTLNIKRLRSLKMIVKGSPRLKKKAEVFIREGKFDVGMSCLEGKI